MSRNLIAGVALFVCLVINGAWTAPGCSQTAPGDAAFKHLDDLVTLDEIADLVEQHFYDPQLDVDLWRQRVAEARKAFQDRNDEDRFDEIANDLLKTLGASHTYYFSKLDPKRYQLLGVFEALYDADRTDLFVYPGIGIDTRDVDGVTRVKAVYDGLPAARAGLKHGDQILSADGAPFHKLRSFQGKVGKSVELQLVRKAEPLKLAVEVEALDCRSMFETALQKSMRGIEHQGRRIGYLHAWSYAGQKYHDRIEGEVLGGQLKDCEGLIVDLRDGWGGASLDYLTLFRQPIADVVSKGRDGIERRYSGRWTKPVVLITNEGSTSGKELLTYGFQKLKLGAVVGQRTAGAVVAGRAFLLSNGAVLYLAVLDVHVDGQRLEGVGVAPTVEVGRPIDDPADPQLQAALDAVADAIER